MSRNKAIPAAFVSHVKDDVSCSNCQACITTSSYASGLRASLSGRKESNSYLEQEYYPLHLERKKNYWGVSVVIVVVVVVFTIDQDIFIPSNP